MYLFSKAAERDAHNRFVICVEFIRIFFYIILIIKSLLLVVTESMIYYSSKYVSCRVSVIAHQRFFCFLEPCHLKLIYIVEMVQYMVEKKKMNKILIKFIIFSIIDFNKIHIRIYIYDKLVIFQILLLNKFTTGYVK